MSVEVELGKLDSDSKALQADYNSSKFFDDFIVEAPVPGLIQSSKQGPRRMPKGTARGGSERWRWFLINNEKRAYKIRTEAIVRYAI